MECGVGGKGTFLIWECCLNSFTWRSPARQAKPKVCYYHRNPLNDHRESWEFNLSQQFYFIIFPLFRLFPSQFVPKSCAGPRLQGRSESHVLDRGAICHKQGHAALRSPLPRLFPPVGRLRLGVCFMVRDASSTMLLGWGEVLLWGSAGCLCSEGLWLL